MSECTARLDNIKTHSQELGVRSTVPEGIHNRRCEVRKAEELQDKAHRLLDQRILRSVKKIAHSDSAKEQRHASQQHVLRIRENAPDFRPAEHFWLTPIDIGVSTPVLCQRHAIHRTLVWCEYASRELCGSGWNTNKERDESKKSRKYAFL